MKIVQCDYLQINTTYLFISRFFNKISFIAPLVTGTVVVMTDITSTEVVR